VPAIDLDTVLVVCSMDLLYPLVLTLVLLLLAKGFLS